MIVSGSDAFDFNTLKEHWDTFAKGKKSQGKEREYSVLNQEISLENDTQVILHLANPIQEDFLNVFKQELVGYLKKKLNNGKITISTKTVTESKKMLYTNNDKLRFLMEQNPLLRDLRDRLDLDPDF